MREPRAKGPLLALFQGRRREPPSPADQCPSEPPLTGAKSVSTDVEKESKKDGNERRGTTAVPKIKPVPFFQLFKYSTNIELLIDAVGLVCAILAGAAQPVMTLVLGRLVNNFSGFTTATYNANSGDADAQANLKAEAQEFLHQAGKNAEYMAFIGVGTFVCTYIYMMAWVYTAEVNAKRIRERYLEATLRQEIAYFDDVGAGEIATRIQTDTDLVQKGIGEKVAMAVSAVSAFVTGFVVGYVRNWRLALAMTSILPVAVFTGWIAMSHIQKNMANSLKLIGESGSIAEETLSSIRTVHAFGVQPALCGIYDVLVDKSRVIRGKTATWFGGTQSVMRFAVYSAYALAFYFGTTLVIDGNATPGVVINVMFAILMGAFAIVQLSPQMQAIQEACGAAAKLYATIDRVPVIDAYSEEGLRPEKCAGDIILKDVYFSYPSRPTVPVTRGVSFHFPSGATTALVGASGSGKSTIVALLERFYDPTAGALELDGVNIKDLNLRWLRSQIGLVSQEPTLFNTTIRENVEHGLANTQYEHLSGEERFKMVKQACEIANADVFISKLPNGYDTVVGERAALLSGGQKQRIAIARAIVADPRILLLDEATSALDTLSEGVVQNALDRAASGRTTVAIAHRLSTIKNADNIYVMGEGVVIEEGTHHSLLTNPDGAYRKLVEAQELREATEGAAVTVHDDDDLKEDPNDMNLGRVQTGRSLTSQMIEKAAHTSDAGRIKYSLLQLVYRMLLVNRRCWPEITIGLIAAFIDGAVFPCFGILFGHVLNGFSLPNNHEKRHAGDRNALWMFIIAILGSITTFIQQLNIISSGVALMARLQSAMFAALLRQDVKYFDKPGHNIGTLVSTLSDDPQKVNGLAGMILANVTESVATIIVGFAIGLSFSWRLGLVAIACTPFILVSGYIRLRVVVLKDKYNRLAHESSAQIACESAGAIRTVASLTREKQCLQAYRESLEHPLRQSNRTAVWSNMFYAFAQSVTFLINALIFWYGAKLVSESKTSITGFFTCLMSIIFACVRGANVFMHAPDMSEARSATEEIVDLFDAVPDIDATSSDGDVISKKASRGRVVFENVHFRYPTRLDVPVLRGLNLTIEPGTYVALVGASGCGKSTIVQLVERFYDPVAGTIYIDGKPVSDLNVAQFRQQMSLVSQEPTLYSGTVRFNVLLGAIKPAAEVTQEEIEEACRQANILDFIESLPDGFDTELGQKGSQLSGGQKQRIAIARALLRDPKVLLLDEATSALDSTSETVVQAALDQAAKGRTTIAIAHRLSTIQNADCIYFIKEGRVSESGTHEQLMAKHGDYFEFVSLQALKG
ncbi:P-loop containing nucleoside triphosphate hydrolase protein [Fistulina hepatica ATCC 64428]|nr:P-loop containing nucleoside triphosphate hydrolase protein [Fistulina hepatica ATCC 64428]